MKTIHTIRSLAIRQGRLVPNSAKPTNVVKGPNGWNIVPDVVKA